MVTASLLEPTPSKPEQAVTTLVTRLIPLYTQYWQTFGERKYHKPFDPHMQLMLELWFGGGLKIIMAQEQGRDIGFATCVIFRPLQYAANVLQVHDLYTSGRTDVLREISEFINHCCRILNCDELWQDADDPQLMSVPIWAPAESVHITRFMRKE